ncbi:MAG: arginine--tRNA ligase [Candidatus Mesenet longicola]|uniref:Arginine--tRNA ligase n=1 Tax=Candidatus Mesenet longicola TaxID=1892558 RepID=A0A8J3MPC7_9RICK|nr:MAG: arginine--tRNA ligase [Candidatus Mesenet longicola]GHM59898.1 MAG: arginine--tRNA ligase [Candidatus Mesenet longicola]
MDIFSRIRDLILQKIGEIKDYSYDAQSIVVEPPNNESHGDVYTNAALILGKIEKKNPMEVAKVLVDVLKPSDVIASIDIASPGFINMHLKQDVWLNVLREVNTLKTDFGNSNIGNNQKINIEFVSANPTGPLHIGHARGAVFGDVLARLLKKAGYDVTKEYYINDAGVQINQLMQSVYLRYKEALKESVNFDDIQYPGEYLKPVGEGLATKYGKELSVEQDFDKIKTYVLDYIIRLIKDDLNLLGVEHDVFTSEYELQKSGIVEKSIKILSDKGLIYHGCLDKPKGKEDPNWKPRKQMLFSSTKFGDDVDRPLQKEDGSWTYFATDIAYHSHKISREFNQMIVVLGTDHAGYTGRLKAIVAALSESKAKIEIKLYNLVKFLDDGKPVKMSKRRGNFLTVKDVVEEVGKDITRFIMLTRKNDVPLDFDFVKVKEQSKDNPVFYVQYAHARAHSLMRRAPKLLSKSEIDLSLLSSHEELLLIKTLAKWPQIVKSAAKACEPHKISFYLTEVAEKFHILWGYGSKNLNMKFIIDDNIALTSARIFLAQAVASVIASGLSIFNIEPLEEMR